MQRRVARLIDPERFALLAAHARMQLQQSIVFRLLVTSCRCVNRFLTPLYYSVAYG